MKYKIISEDDVYKTMVSCCMEMLNPVEGAINIKNMASLLNTSRYQVKKYIEVLKAKGMVELKCYCIDIDEEGIPPYWGYRLTKKGRDTEYYKQEEKKEIELIEECFGE